MTMMRAVPNAVVLAKYDVWGKSSEDWEGVYPSYSRNV